MAANDLFAANDISRILFVAIYKSDIPPQTAKIIVVQISGNDFSLSDFRQEI